MSGTHTVVRSAEVFAGGFRFARALDAAGVERRAGVAVLLPNVAEFCFTYRGVAWSGRRFTPLSWRWTPDDVAYVVADSEADVLVAHARFADAALAAAHHVDPDRRFVVGGELAGFRPWAEVVDAQPGHDYEHPLAGETLLYTSGTTGRPKGVLRPFAPDAPPPSRVGRGGMGMIRQYFPDGIAGSHLVACPLYHSGPVAYCEGASLLGQDVVLMDGWDPEAMLALVEAERVTSVFLVPAQFVRLMRLPAEVRARYDVSSLRLVCHGSAPVSVEVKRSMIDWLGPVLYEFYGGTEGGGCSISSPEWLTHPGSVGRPLPGLELVVLDDDGRPVPAGAEGTVWFRQPDSFTYKGDAAKTAEARRDDLMTLGDVGFVDDEGYLYLCDRRADVVISGGVNLYPAKVEGVVVAHPEVVDCCVVGVPDDDWGEALHALVELRRAGAWADAGPGPAPAAVEAALRTWCEGRLGSLEVPRTFEVRASLPRTETGKLARRALRDPYWAGRSRRI